MGTADSSITGVLETAPQGHGYLRDPSRNFKPGPSDVYVPAPLVSRYRLTQGLTLSGRQGPAEKGPSPLLLELTAIEGQEPEIFLARKGFDDLTAIDPRERIRLETGPEPLGPRIIDLLTPIGKGQRGLVVAPPRSGKTVLLQQIASAVLTNHPEMQLVVLLIDERPEEVTEMRRTISAEVVASSNDREVEEHLRLAQLTFDRAKHSAESGRDVLVLLDSLTRLARAFNKNSSTGRTMSGGVDIKALDAPKRLFGSARCFEEGGSLTVLATCLVETGSRMDEVIFQEFKGTGNMELVLDRRLAERRVWPAIDIAQSGTRKEERLMDAESLRRTALLRRTLADMKPVEAMEGLVLQMSKFPSNSAFLDRIGQARK